MTRFSTYFLSSENRAQNQFVWLELEVIAVRQENRRNLMTSFNNILKFLKQLSRGDANFSQLNFDI